MSIGLSFQVSKFDLATHRRTETSLGTIRRFVRFLLENVSVYCILKCYRFFIKFWGILRNQNFWAPWGCNDHSLKILTLIIHFPILQIIPVEYHSKYTLRERGGQDYLTELPPELLLLIRGKVTLSISFLNKCLDMCFEALNLYEPRTVSTAKNYYFLIKNEFL